MPKRKQPASIDETNIDVMFERLTLAQPDGDGAASPPIETSDVVESDSAKPLYFQILLVHFECQDSQPRTVHIYKVSYTSGPRLLIDSPLTRNFHCLCCFSFQHLLSTLSRLSCQ